MQCFEAENGIKCYIFNISDFSDEEYVKWYNLLSDEKRQKIDCFRFDEDKKRTVVGEMLARKAISERCGVSPESIVFNKKENGKPYAEGFAVEFNISHSGDVVVCAVADKSVGADIEKIRPIDLVVAKRVCTDAELIKLFGRKPTEQDFVYTEDIEILTRFFELWTEKEAVLKCNGEGIAFLSNCKKTYTGTNILKIRVEGYACSVCVAD